MTTRWPPPQQRHFKPTYDVEGPFRASLRSRSLATRALWAAAIAAAVLTVLGLVLR